MTVKRSKFRLCPKLIILLHLQQTLSEIPKPIFDFFQNHQEGDHLQKAREIPAVSFAVSTERALAAGACQIRLLYVPDLLEQ